jgi:hypothetical protein
VRGILWSACRVATQRSLLHQKLQCQLTLSVRLNIKYSVFSFSGDLACRGSSRFPSRSCLRGEGQLVRASQEGPGLRVWDARACVAAGDCSARWRERRASWRPKSGLGLSLVCLFVSLSHLSICLSVGFRFRVTLSYPPPKKNKKTGTCVSPKSLNPV